MGEDKKNPFTVFTNTGSHDAEIAERSFIANQQKAVASPLFTALSVFDQNRAMNYALQLDETSYEELLTFGADAQHEMKKFTNKMLLHVQRNDTSRVREILHQLTTHLEQVNPEALTEQEQGFFARIFKRQKASVLEVMSQYNRLSKQIDRLNIQLQHIQHGLMNDHTMLDELYRLNEQYFMELNVYIAAAEIKRDQLLNVNVSPVEATGQELPFDNEEHALQTAIETLDRRLYDLQISREIAIQCAPQIRMMQQTGQMLMEKIQTSTLTTIPLWQSQISMLLSMNNQRRVNSAQQRLDTAAATMQRKNAQMYEVQANELGKQAMPREQVQQFKVTQEKLLQELQETMAVESAVSEKHAKVQSSVSTL